MAKLTKLDTEIKLVDRTNPQIFKKLISFLAPNEIFSLFILGNLKNIAFDSFIYTAEKDGKIIGACGYYPTFKSMSFFTNNNTATKKFANIVSSNHPVQTLLAYGKTAKIAFEELLKLGLTSISQPPLHECRGLRKQA
ncbi:MAG: hypothetical protein HZB76_01920 [Chlamydiae bacterium]|nr:hypothetical protein [Chlamydiota bacterium]